MSDKTSEEIGQDISLFLSTDTGVRYLQALELKYNTLHRNAEEITLNIEQKAMSIERAAGVKWCIEWLTQRSISYESGYYTKKKV